MDRQVVVDGIAHRVHVGGNQYGRYYVLLQEMDDDGGHDLVLLQHEARVKGAALKMCDGNDMATSAITDVHCQQLRVGR